jgi:hypothetical protein
MRNRRSCYRSVAPVVALERGRQLGQRGAGGGVALADRAQLARQRSDHRRQGVGLVDQVVRAPDPHAQAEIATPA